MEWKQKKIINLLNNSGNDQSKFAAKNGMLWTIKQQLKINTMKTIILTLKQTPLNQVFDQSDVYTLVAADIMVAGAWCCS